MVNFKKQLCLVFISKTKKKLTSLSDSMSYVSLISSLFRYTFYTSHSNCFFTAEVSQHISTIWSLHHSISPTLTTPSLHNYILSPLHCCTTPLHQHFSTPPLHHSNSTSLHHSITLPSITQSFVHSATPPIHDSTGLSLHHSITPPLHHPISSSLHHSITPPSIIPSLHLSWLSSKHLGLQGDIYHRIWFGEIRLVTSLMR